MYIYLSTCLSINPTIYVYISFHLYIYLLSICPSVNYFYIFLPICLSIYSSDHISIYLYIQLSKYPSIYISIYLYIHITIYPSVFISIHVLKSPIYQIIHLFNESIVLIYPSIHNPLINNPSIHQSINP